MEKRTKANSHRQITVIAFDALKDDSHSAWIPDSSEQTVITLW